MACAKSAHRWHYWNMNPGFHIHATWVALEERGVLILPKCEVFRLATVIYVCDSVTMTGNLVSCGTSWSHRSFRVWLVEDSGLSLTNLQPIG